MPTAGGRPEIGPITLPQAAWLISGDPRAATYALGQAEVSGAVPWHFWDPDGGAQGRGGWMDTRRWPGFWPDPRSGVPPRNLLQPVAPEVGWKPDAAHQPDLAFLPYLLTGRRALLDELQAQAAWNIVSVYPPKRDDPARTGVSAGLNVVNQQQVRAAAWSIRQIDEAAWLSPDGDPHEAYLREAAAANWAWLRSMTSTWTAQQGEAHGWIPGVYGPGIMAPWQQDFFASSAAAAARRGSDDARAVLGWMTNFLAGRFLALGRGFNPRDGIAYNLATAPVDRPNQIFRTWAEWGEATRARGWSNGDGWGRTNGDYLRLALQSLAALQDVLGTEDARRAYLWLSSAAGAPGIRPEDYAAYPTLNVVPKGVPRIPVQAPSCTRAGTRL
jgi:hypothetical protein